MNVFDLKPNQELRFQVGEEPVKLELRRGLAEVYGTEMFSNNTYTFPKKSKAAVFTYQGATVEMTGTPLKSHVGQKCDYMTCYLKIHGELEKTREEAEALSEHINFNPKQNDNNIENNDASTTPQSESNSNQQDLTKPSPSKPDISKTPICLICKPADARNVGKSTLCRILLNYAARRGRAPIFVDLDPDQGHIGIPGTIGALSIESPIDIETGLQLQSSLLMHFGHTSPSADSENKSGLVYKAIVENMTKLVHSKLEKDKKSYSSGVIINSCSWSDDAEYKILVHICKVFKVNMVIVMDDEVLRDDLKKDLSDCQPPVTVYSVPKTVGIATRARETSVESRYQRIKEYFYGTPTESYSPMTSEVKFAFLKRLIYRIGQPIMLPDSLMPLGSKARDQNVKVSQYDCSASELLHHILAVSYCKIDELDQDPDAVLRKNIMGFICVTSLICLILLRTKTQPITRDIMDNFCRSPLWQYNLTWNITTQPDFTPCFQETILVWVPCIILWLFAPLEILNIYKSERKYIPVTLLNLFKTFLATVLCLLSVSELLEGLLKTDADPAPVDYTTPIVKSLTYILVFGMNVLYRKRGVHTSGLMFLFWLLMSVATVINLRSLLRSTFHDGATTTIANWNISELRFTLRVVSAPIVIIQLVMSCIADKRARYPYLATGENYRNVSPENDASIVSLLTFWWLNSIMFLGYKRALTQEDLYAIKPSNRTETVSQKFDALLTPAIQKALDEKREHSFNPKLDAASRKLLNGRNTSQRSSWIPLVRKRPQARPTSRDDKEKGENKSNDDEPAKFVSITRIVIRSFWPRLLIGSILKFVSSLLTFASPLLLSCIITFVSSDEPNWRGGLYAAALFFLSVAEVVLSNREQFITSVNVMRIRTCLTAAVYRKTLRLSNQGRKDYTTGQIVNLMSVDTQRVADFVQNFNSIWSAPLQLAVSMILLYQQLGMSIFAGLIVMLINGPFNGWITVKIRALQMSVMRFKDKRIKLLSEIFNGIKIIKVHAWEDPFRKRTESIRAKEIEGLTKQAWYSSAITFAFTSLPFVVAVTSFATYILIDENNILDANRIFVSLSLFNIIRVPLGILPMLIMNLSTFLVAVRRLNRFLESEEIEPDAVKDIDDESLAIKIKDASFKWEREGEMTLHNVNLTIPRRKLVAVVGQVGSGKSSLMSAILGDMEKCDGEVLVDQSSRIAYVPQEAWILNTTFKNNIMFNKVINEDKYRRVLDACALVPDLKTLEHGDESEIGEKGINLSGGQKQRVSLARAVYADTDIYLMDDPLHAVDVHVGRHIFDNVIGPKGLLRDRTRVLVTNKLSVLPDVDLIIVLQDGKVSEEGTYEQLLKNRGAFSQLIVKYVLENADTTNISEDARADMITKELKRLEEKQTQEALNSNEADQSPKKPDVKESKSTGDVDKHPGAKKHGDSVRDLTGQEVSQVGSVGLDIHMNFIRTMGMNFVIALCIFILSSAFTLTSNVWLSDWSNDALNDTLKNNTSQRNMRLGVYAGLGFAESFCMITSTILLNLACLRSSQMLHNRMLGRVLKAPMSWFNTTPSGRIMNRFSKDVDTVDVTIRFNVRFLMVIALRSVTSLILISVGSVYSIILIVPAVLLYFLLQIFYISTSRQLKRVESTTKSPIYSHFTETIFGITSIRAFGVSQEFILESNHRVDVNNSAYYIGFVSSRWLAIRLEFLGFIVVLTASLVAVLSRETISPGIAGLSVSYSLTVTSVLSLLVRMYSDYETNVVSVERLLEYTRTPVEPEDEEEPSDPDWPSRGEILFDEFSARYRPELELVLNKLNLKVDPIEKVGLVGRTGAGKSSITLALFRLIEAAEGRIVIDDVDISHIQLRLLRSKLSIIPQDPVLFSGTVRQNIDPTESHPDDEIWRAIDLAHLGQFIRSLSSSLDHEVSEGGSNFSVGQKQLFCLARALLRRSKILILDEATAAVDVETDTLIQQTIRKEFKDSTILTVAHRIETIQDYDRVVVMDSGIIAEQGTPKDLMKNVRSRYYKLAKEASSS